MFGSKEMIYLSIIIPVYNEQRRLKGVKRVLSFLKKQNFTSEVIIVNDGSNDQTLGMLKEYLLWNKGHEGPALKIISYQDNCGKGYAIKKGMTKARGKYHLFFDVDLSTPLSELKAFIPHLRNHDLVIGSRKMKGARLNEKQPVIREWLGKGFTFLSAVVLGVWVSDFTCGFKCFSRKASKEIFGKSRVKRWGFDSEILFLANKMGFVIKEIPVRWKNDKDTKVRFPKDIILSLKELLEIIKNDRMGYYS